MALLRRTRALTRQLSAQLPADHGLTLSDYEVLLRLARAPDRRMRRVDLAEQVLLTRVGHHPAARRARAASGYVERARAATDRRVVYAVLTDAGLERLREASASHVGADRRVLRREARRGRARVADAAADRLGEGESDAADCSPPE